MTRSSEENESPDLNQTVDYENMTISGESRKTPLRTFANVPRSQLSSANFFGAGTENLPLWRYTSAE
jgi:hypothetical protein